MTAQCSPAAGSTSATPSSPAVRSASASRSAPVGFGWGAPPSSTSPAALSTSTRRQFSGGVVDFYRAKFSGGDVYFGGAEFSGADVYFSGAEFSGSRVDFRNNGQFTFDDARFSGGTVDFSDPRDWSFPPTFSQRHVPPPPVLKLPRKEGEPGA